MVHHLSDFFICSSVNIHYSYPGVPENSQQCLLSLYVKRSICTVNRQMYHDSDPTPNPIPNLNIIDLVDTVTATSPAQPTLRAYTVSVYVVLLTAIIAQS